MLQTVYLISSWETKHQPALDWFPKPIKVSIFKEVRSVMVMVDLAPDVWDDVLQKLETDLANLISEEEQSLLEWWNKFIREQE